MDLILNDNRWSFVKKDLEKGLIDIPEMIEPKKVNVVQEHQVLDMVEIPVKALDMVEILGEVPDMAEALVLEESQTKAHEYKEQL